MQVQVDKTRTTNEQQDIQRIGSIQISKGDAAAGNMPCGSNEYPAISLLFNFLKSLLTLYIQGASSLIDLQSQ